MIGGHIKFDMRLSELATAVESNYDGLDITFTGLSIDSRSLKPGNIFIAIKGPSFDGHDYIAQAIESGASGILVETPGDYKVPFIKTKNCKIALGDIARCWRQEFKTPLIAITGSNGKTTVKEMIVSILKQQANVLFTQGNLNNDFGVPLTLLNMTSQHQFAVVEMGASHSGDIEYLTHIAKPDIAVITNVAAAHLQGFGSIDDIAKAKGEIFLGLNNKGVAILNADDKYFNYWQTLCQNKIVSFGLSSCADVFIKSVYADNKIVIQTPTDEIQVNLLLLGQHNILNALAATAATVAMSVDLQSIKNGLENINAVPGRLELKQGIHGCRIIDDTYNANPSSLFAGLQVLKSYPGKHILAFGDMGELGCHSDELHCDAGKQIKQAGIDKLFTIGKLAKYTATCFGDNANHFLEYDKMVMSIKKDMNTKSTLLVKGSRFMHMENIVNSLLNNAEVN